MFVTEHFNFRYLNEFTGSIPTGSFIIDDAKLELLMEVKELFKDCQEKTIEIDSLWAKWNTILVEKELNLTIDDHQAPVTPFQENLSMEGMVIEVDNQDRVSIISSMDQSVMSEHGVAEPKDNDSILHNLHNSHLHNWIADLWHHKNWDIPPGPIYSALDFEPLLQRKSASESLPLEPTNVLEKWIEDHEDNPYPTDQEKIALANEANMTVMQVNNWFVNVRRRNMGRFASSRRGRHQSGATNTTSRAGSTDSRMSRQDSRYSVRSSYSGLSRAHSRESLNSTCSSLSSPTSIYNSGDDVRLKIYTDNTFQVNFRYRR